MDNEPRKAGQAYCPPQITYVGHLADLTQLLPPGKEVDEDDGTTFQGISAGSVGVVGGA